MLSLLPDVWTGNLSRRLRFSGGSDCVVAVPIELKDAQSYINKYHRHHQAAHRDKFRIAAMQDDEIVGVVQVGRPVSRVLDDGKTLEVLRFKGGSKIMTKKLKEMNIELASNYADELKMLVYSLCEDIKDSESMTDAWNKIDRFYKDAEAMRNKQKCTGSKSFSILTDDVDGHTKYLQGINLPIMVNTIWESEDNCKPSEVSEMHIGSVNGIQTLIITPEDISLPI